MQRLEQQHQLQGRQGLYYGPTGAHGWGSQGSDNGEFSNPAGGIAIDSDGGAPMFEPSAAKARTTGYSPVLPASPSTTRATLLYLTTATLVCKCIG